MSTTDDIAKRNCTEKTCLETVVSTTDDIARRNYKRTTDLETVVSTTDEGAQPQAPVAFTEPTTVQYLPKEATQPLGRETNIAHVPRRVL